MTHDHLRQRLPNRRFRRLFPAAVAAVTIAASAPFAASAHAESHPHPKPKAAHVQSPGKIPTQPKANTIRGDQVDSTTEV
jgi:hypothetical protein